MQIELYCNGRTYATTEPPTILTSDSTWRELDLSQMADEVWDGAEI